MTYSFTVLGTPKPQGSKRAFVVKGKARMVESAGAPLNDWRAAVAQFAQQVIHFPLEGPIAMSVIFYMPKPKSAPKWKIWCDKKPDIDKLARSTLDGLTGVAYVDDGQVVDLRCTMFYAIGRATGCEVRMRCLGAAERESGGYLPFLGTDPA